MLDYGFPGEAEILFQKEIFRNFGIHFFSISSTLCVYTVSYRTINNISRHPANIEWPSKIVLVRQIM